MAKCEPCCAYSSPDNWGRVLVATCVFSECMPHPCRTLGAACARERFLSEAGVGWVRLYPAGVGSFEGVVEHVDAYLSDLNRAAEAEVARLAHSHAALKATAAASGAAAGAAAGAGAASALPAVRLIDSPVVAAPVEAPRLDSDEELGGLFE